MKQFFIALSAFLLICLFSCSESERNNISEELENLESDPERLESFIEKYNQLEVGSSTNVPGSNYIFFELDNKLPDSKTLKNYQSSDIKYSRGSYSNLITWNLLFYNVETKSKHLLLDDKAIIVGTHLPNLAVVADQSETIDQFSRNGYIIYEIIDHDFNNDGVLDLNDPTYLYFSDTSGRNLTRLSPKYHGLEHWKFLKDDDLIEMRLTMDSNGDSLFNRYNKDWPDRNTIVEVSLTTPAEHRIIMDTVLQDSLGNLFVKELLEQ